VIATLDAALAKKGESVKSIETWKQEMPTEAEMLPRDKYTMFDRKEKRYRKGIHSEFWALDNPLETRRANRKNETLEGDAQQRAKGVYTLILRQLADLKNNRATKVDKSIPESQPSRLLKELYGWSGIRLLFWADQHERNALLQSSEHPLLGILSSP
jgi:hypothetical protein